MNNQSKSLTRFILAMGGYALLLIASVLLLPATPAGWLRVLVALLPVIPAVYGLAVIIGVVRGMDEFQQRIQLEAVAFSLIATALLTFTYGFLENAGFPPLSVIWVLPLIVALWGVGQLIAGRRYQ
jgi:hypothetical protein